MISEDHISVANE